MIALGDVTHDPSNDEDPRRGGRTPAHWWDRLRVQDEWIEIVSGRTQMKHEVWLAVTRSAGA